MSDFSRDQFRQVRIARDRTVSACRNGYFRFHSYMNQRSSQHRRIVENALYDTFLYTVCANRDSIDIKQMYERECGIILRYLNTLRLSSPSYEAKWHERDIDGHDIVYNNESTGMCRGREAYTYPMSYPLDDSMHMPPGVDTNIHICPNFFSYTTERRQVLVIIHELCHSVLAFGYLDSDVDIYRDDFDLYPYNSASIPTSLRTPDKYSNFILAISGLFR